MDDIFAPIFTCNVILGVMGYLNCLGEVHMTLFREGRKMYLSRGYIKVCPALGIPPPHKRQTWKSNKDLTLDKMYISIFQYQLLMSNLHPLHLPSLGGLVDSIHEQLTTGGSTLSGMYVCAWCRLCAVLALAVLYSLVVVPPATLTVRRLPLHTGTRTRSAQCLKQSTCKHQSEGICYAA